MLLFLQRQTPQNNIFGQLFDRFFMEADFEPGREGRLIHEIDRDARRLA